MKKTLITILCASSFAANVFGQSAADSLLDNVEAPEPKAQKNKTAKARMAIDPNMSTVTNGNIQLSDPFQIQFFTNWKSERNLSFDVHQWAQLILKQNYEGAAHLWTMLQPQMPQSFQQTAQAAQVYLLWKLNLPQTFVDEWIPLFARPAFAESAVGRALEAVISPSFDQWLAEAAVTFSPDQEELIKNMDENTSPMVMTLKAWAYLRKGLAAEPFLTRLSASHPMKINLAQTVALAYIKAKNLSKAAHVLKEHVEPALTQRQDAALYSSHIIEVARILYQSGALDAAETYYEKVPSGAAQFLDAREELLWVWLRKNDISKLRGELATFSTKLFDDHFAPEIYLVRAVSNLKLCFYDEVEKDFKGFLELNTRWAGRIQAALNSGMPMEPSAPDSFSLRAVRALKNRQQEKVHLSALAEKSITAVLPAVGPQAQWTRAETKMDKTIDRAQKNLANEYRRQWNNDRIALTESIRKMRFVKIELMSQIRMAAPKTDEAKTEAKKKGNLSLETQSDSLNFPFDGVVWADELFHLRSVAQGRCLNARGVTK